MPHKRPFTRKQARVPRSPLLTVESKRRMLPLLVVIWDRPFMQPAGLYCIYLLAVITVYRLDWVKLD